MNYNKYSYDGPVEDAVTGRCVTRQWRSETHAVSKDKARSNLMFQYKKEFGLERNVRVRLPGEIKTHIRKD